MSDLESEVKEFFESGGEKVPEGVEEEKKEVAPPEKEEAKAEKVEKVEKTEKAEKKDEDPHAENHRKALKETREELKRYKEELRQRDERHKALEEKFNIFVSEAKKAGEPKPPAFEEDPASHLKYETEQVKRQLEESRQWQTRQDQHFQQQQQRQMLVGELRRHEGDFAQANPDYEQAAQYVLKAKQAELSAYGVPQEQIPQVYENWVLGMAMMNLRSGKNPAEAVYQIAQSIGYRKAEKQDNEAEKISRLQKGVESSKSLGSGTSGTELSLEALEEMSAEEIAALVKDDKNWNKIQRL